MEGLGGGVRKYAAHRGDKPHKFLPISFLFVTFVARKQSPLNNY